jgi:hypothetical protein
MLQRSLSISPEADKQFNLIHRQLRTYGIQTQELYASLFFDLILKLSRGTLQNPRGISADTERNLHTIYEFDENGLLGHYSCTPLNVVLLDVEPNPEFFKEVEAVRITEAA